MALVKRIWFVVEADPRTGRERKLWAGESPVYASQLEMELKEFNRGMYPDGCPGHEFGHRDYRIERVTVMNSWDGFKAKWAQLLKLYVGVRAEFQLLIFGALLGASFLAGVILL